MNRRDFFSRGLIGAIAAAVWPFRHEIEFKVADGDGPRMAVGDGLDPQGGFLVPGHLQAHVQKMFRNPGAVVRSNWPKIGFTCEYKGAPASKRT